MIKKIFLPSVENEPNHWRIQLDGYCIADLNWDMREVNEHLWKPIHEAMTGFKYFYICKSYIDANGNMLDAAGIRMAYDKHLRGIGDLIG